MLLIVLLHTPLVTFNKGDKERPSDKWHDMYIVIKLHASISAVHDCRPEFIQDFRDQQQWEAYLFQHGLNKTYDDVNSLHYKPKQEPGTGSRK